MAAAGGHWTKISSGEKAGTRVFVPKGIDDGFPIFVMQTFNKPYMQYLNEQKKAGALINPQELPKGAKPALKTPKVAGPDLFNPSGVTAAPKAAAPAVTSKTFLKMGKGQTKVINGIQVYRFVTGGWQVGIETVQTSKEAKVIFDFLSKADIAPF